MSHCESAPRQKSPADIAADIAWKKKWGKAWAKARKASTRPLNCREEIRFVVPVDPQRERSQRVENAVAERFGRTPRLRSHVLAPCTEAEDAGKGELPVNGESIDAYYPGHIQNITAAAKGGRSGEFSVL